ncbi:hypothetical protein ASPBRDRAFT_44866 [Aspergillus brasiliensis CBS 101740]|uniref:Uncharacterized protein n=1 Tax=Aspergillus brasiliensis (strain CBS 101740 / IMI 381727 / IBT 21946) TaxID=767769 RepID=A0A1L9UG36_ASPBC|nr:hypothetical protein ASPBRDRAFT_44866 [Aspergillus brasiliensis CBS 101740]
MEGYCPHCAAAGPTQNLHGGAFSRLNWIHWIHWTRLQPSNRQLDRPVSLSFFLAFPWFLAFGAPNYHPTLTTLSSKIFHSCVSLPPPPLLSGLSVYLRASPNSTSLSVGTWWILGLKSWASTQRWVDDGLCLLVMFATEPRGKRLLLFVRSQACCGTAEWRPPGPLFLVEIPCEVNDQRSKLDTSSSIVLHSKRKQC